MSEANLKKGSGCFLSTTLDAGRLTLVDDVSVGSDHPLGFAAYMSEASLKKGSG